jgi:hypothetical protein
MSTYYAAGLVFYQIKCFMKDTSKQCMEEYTIPVRRVMNYRLRNSKIPTGSFIKF